MSHFFILFLFSKSCIFPLYNMGIVYSVDSMRCKTSPCGRWNCCPCIKEGKGWGWCGRLKWLPCSIWALYEVQWYISWGDKRGPTSYDLSPHRGGRRQYPWCRFFTNSRVGLDLTLSLNLSRCRFHHLVLIVPDTRMGMVCPCLQLVPCCPSNERL